VGLGGDRARSHSAGAEAVLCEVVRLTWISRLLLSSSMIRPRHAVLVVLLSLAAFGTGCTDNPVGRICDLGTAQPQPADIVVSSPSLDCVSRTCLRVPLGRELPPGGSFPSGSSGLCTAECAADSDCDRVPESPCLTGFTCGAATNAGSFCCKKVCICKDYVVIPASGAYPIPAACDAKNPLNECCNLEGRQGNPMYPKCKT
jgi:hypothetical protein